MTVTCANCDQPLDPTGVSLDFCEPECQEKWMAKGAVPLPGISSVVPVPQPAGPPRHTNLPCSVVPVVKPPTPVAVEVPADAPTRVARLGRIGRLRMGRRG